MNPKIKILAKTAAQEKEIPQDIQEYVLKVLTKRELKLFFNLYKLELAKKKVLIASPRTLSQSELSDLKKMFPHKEIENIIDESLGAGLRIQDNDTIIDFSIKNYIFETIDKLKN